MKKKFFFGTAMSLLLAAQAGAIEHPTCIIKVPDLDHVRENQIIDLNKQMNGFMGLYFSDPFHTSVTALVEQALHRKGYKTVRFDNRYIDEIIHSAAEARECKAQQAEEKATQLASQETPGQSKAGAQEQQAKQTEQKQVVEKKYEDYLHAGELFAEINVGWHSSNNFLDRLDVVAKLSEAAIVDNILQRVEYSAGTAHEESHEINHEKYTKHHGIFNFKFHFHFGHHHKDDKKVEKSVIDVEQVVNRALANIQDCHVRP